MALLCRYFCPFRVKDNIKKYFTIKTAFGEIWVFTHIWGIISTVHFRDVGNKSWTWAQKNSVICLREYILSVRWHMRTGAQYSISCVFQKIPSIAKETKVI